jgi:hypothetical protein
VVEDTDTAAAPAASLGLSEAVSEPVAASLEPAAAPAATVAAAAPVAEPARLVKLDTVDRAISVWFSSVFTGSPIASGPGNWNTLVSAVDQLREVIMNHVNADQ